MLSISSHAVTILFPPIQPSFHIHVPHALIGECQLTPVLEQKSVLDQNSGEYSGIGYDYLCTSNLVVNLPL